MYMALLPLLIAASSWIVLRKNPAFSARHVLQFFAVLTAMVGAFVLAILATLKSSITQTRPDEADPVDRHWSAAASP